MYYYHVISDIPKRKGSQPIVEILADGDIEVVEIMKEINANIPE